MHEAVYQFAQKSRARQSLFRNSSLKSEIEIQLAPVYRRLEELNLLKTPAERVRSWTAFAVAFLVITVTGGAILLFELTKLSPDFTQDNLDRFLFRLAIPLFSIWVHSISVGEGRCNALLRQPNGLQSMEKYSVLPFDQVRCTFGQLTLNTPKSKPRV